MCFLVACGGEQSDMQGKEGVPEPQKEKVSKNVVEDFQKNRDMVSVNKAAPDTASELSQIAAADSSVEAQAGPLPEKSENVGLNDSAKTLAETAVKKDSSEGAAKQKIQESSSSSIMVAADPESSSSSEGEPALSSAAIDSSLCGEVPQGHFCDYRDGHVYKMAYIGAQVWMAENLNFNAEGSWCYNDDEKNCGKYGRLYKWTTAVGLEDQYLEISAKKVLKWKMRGVCPEGWHVPSMNEMNVLYSFVQEKNEANPNVHEDVGTSLKSKVGWEEDDEVPAGTNRYGFAAKPAGFRNEKGNFTNMTEDASFWVLDEVDSDPTHAPYWNLYYANEKFWGNSNNFKSFALSLRCLKN